MARTRIFSEFLDFSIFDFNRGCRSFWPNPPHFATTFGTQKIEKNQVAKNSSKVHATSSRLPPVSSKSVYGARSYPGPKFWRFPEICPKRPTTPTEIENRKIEKFRKISRWGQKMQNLFFFSENYGDSRQNGRGRPKIASTFGPTDFRGQNVQKPIFAFSRFHGRKSVWTKVDAIVGLPRPF